ncbi:MAG: hypothetical protein ACI9D4_002457, partial [Polaribacter sp.]
NTQQTIYNNVGNNKKSATMKQLIVLFKLLIYDML